MPPDRFRHQIKKSASELNLCSQLYPINPACKPDATLTHG